MGKLIMVGFKCAVLGVDPLDPLGAWHILTPGTFNVPTLGNGNKTIGRSLCRREVITNGYASDFVPPGEQLCGACRERL